MISGFLGLAANFLVVAVTSRFTARVDAARIERFEQLLAEEE